tara:strand:- start:566 stop:1021 length:456 start_codon:yes stop_codon:yes gene_type:complete
LYVCTYWGVRSRIAELLTTALEKPELVVECAGFETGKIGKLPREIMAERGLDLSVVSPDSIFKFARLHTEFDYVVTLCNEQTQENYLVLYDVVDSLFSGHTKILHWNIPDFMSLTSEGEERKAEARGIVSAIEKEVCRLVSRISVGEKISV